MRLFPSFVFGALLICCAIPVAGEEPDNVELFYPLTLRRPVFETLLDFTVSHTKGGGERETEFGAELEYRALPWWKISLDLPVIITNPGRGTTLAGIGDIGIENSFRLFQSIPHQAEIIGGFELRVPSGAKTRGGETAIEPFLAGGVKMGDFHVLADAAYEWTLHSPDSGEKKQELSLGLAAAYELTERFLPLLEMKTVRMIRGSESGLRGKQQVYLTPGLNFKFTDEIVLRHGVELPVTRVREFDYAVLTGLSWEF